MQAHLRSVVSLARWRYLRRPATTAWQHFSTDSRKAEQEKITLFEHDESLFFRAFGSFLALHPCYWIYSVADRLLLPSASAQTSAGAEAVEQLYGSETIVTHPYWSVVGLGLSLGMLYVVPMYSRMYISKLVYDPSAGGSMEVTTNEPFGMRGSVTKMPIRELALWSDRVVRPADEEQYFQVEVKEWRDRLLRGRCLVNRRGGSFPEGEERLVRILGGTVATNANVENDNAGDSSQPSDFETESAAQAQQMLDFKRRNGVRRRGGRRKQIK